MAQTISLTAGVDPTLPDVTLKIGGKVRKLAYDFGAIVIAEKLTGVNLMRACTFQDLSFTEVRGLLYAALLHDDPELKLEELDTWSIAYNLLPIQAAVASAWFGSVSDEEPNEPGKAVAQAPKQTPKRKTKPKV